MKVPALACICYGISVLGVATYTKNLGELLLQERIFIVITINYMIYEMVCYHLVGGSRFVVGWV